MRQLVLGLIAGLIAGALIIGGFVIVSDEISSSRSAVGYNEIASNGNVQGRLYTGDPAAESELVSEEESRLAYLRTVTSAAEWHFAAAAEPYRIQTGNRTTLVLTPRETPYTLDDLAILLSEGFRVLPDGSFLLMESVVVLEGATLVVGLEGAVPFTLLLDSTAESFVSILSLGGTVDVVGTLSAPITIASWDSTKGTADSVTADGRAYIRAIGGVVDLGFAFFTDLGFWSGNTGGVSISGGSIPIPPTGSDAAPTEEQTGTAPLLPSVEVDAFALDRASAAGSVFASVENVTFERNAFGLFVTDSSAITISNSAIKDSLIDGLVLHRFVTGAVVTNTTSTGNAVDGITVSRSSDKLTFSEVTSAGNGRNGMSIDGTPLADGPSPAGSSVHSFGDSQVLNSTFSDNGRYGVEVAGAHDVLLHSNTLVGNDIGVVTSGLAERVTITGNEFIDQVRQSVAVRDGSLAIEVTSNAIRGGETGVYVRNADVTIESNSLSKLTNHGVTLLGTSAGTQVHDNSIGGSGTSPIFRDEAAESSKVSGNRTTEWRPAVTPGSVAKSFFQPLTIIWLSLALLLVVTALARGRRRAHVGVDPYANMAPLSSFSRGIVSPLNENRGR